MRILVLTSRYTASRDIIEEDFGRQIRLFSALARLGHKIDFLVADYRKFEKKNTRLHGIDVHIRPFGVFSLLSFLGNLDERLKNGKYGILIGSSDPLWGVFGHYFAKRNNVKFLYDLHDNYETYAAYKIPFFRHFDRHAIKNSDIITTISFALKEKISKVRKANVFTVQNGVDLKLFRPIDRNLSRKKLKLPISSRIIAYTGSLQKSLGVDILARVFEKLKKELPNAKLLLVGRLSKAKRDMPDIKNHGIITFDAPSQDKVVLAINAADVVVIPSPTNEFTKYCFPYKCVEYMACNTPIVATSLSDVKLMLGNYKDSLCEPDSENELYKKTKSQSTKGKINYRKNLKNFTWDRMAMKLHKIITRK